MEYPEDNKKGSNNLNIPKSIWNILRRAATRLFVMVIASYVFSLLYCYVFLDGQEAYNIWFDLTLLLPILGAVFGFFIIYCVEKTKISEKSTFWKVLLLIFLILGMGIPIVIGGYYQFLAIRVNTAGVACLVLGLLSAWAGKKEQGAEVTAQKTEGEESKKAVPVSSILKVCQWICALPLLWYAEVAYTVAIWNYDTYYNLVSFLTGYFAVMVVFAVLTIIAWGWQKKKMFSICGRFLLAAFTCMMMTLFTGLYISGFFL